MGLGTKHRQEQTAQLCKQHLREKYKEKLELVNEYIADFEGRGKDIKKWSKFTDQKRSDEEVLERLDAEFEKWLG